MKDKKPTIVVTGGHHTPAFAVLDELLKRNNSIQVVWFGHRYSLWGSKKESAEYTEVLNRKYEFVNLRAGKFYRVYNPLRWLLIPYGLITSIYYLLKFRPKLVLSFGGYLAVPVVIGASVLGIPSITHEQTATLGMANKLISRFSSFVFLTWEKSKEYLQRKDVEVVGNPVRKSIWTTSDDLIHSLSRGFDEKYKTIYITGGKQGAHFVNEVVEESLPYLLSRYNVIHQTGNAPPYNDFDKLTKIRKNMVYEHKNRYIVKEYFTEQEVGSVYSISDIIISRAGANVVYEIALLGKVAIFIPLKYSPNNEQIENAKILVEAGSSLLINQEEFNKDSLTEALFIIERDYDQRILSARNYSKTLPKEACVDIVNLILEKYPIFT